MKTLQSHLSFALSSLILFLFVAPPSSSSQPSPTPPTADVPFVGCKSDGQMGPMKAPTGKSKTLPIPAANAERLAYFQGYNGISVLAPRGWYCFSTYGSNGESLFVSSEPINATQLLSSDWKGFTNPVIQLSVSVGDTSGRFEVARFIARVFPAHKDFVENVIAEGIEPNESFPSGVYPNDKLTYLTNEMVEYQTPANADGLGTSSRLLKTSAPISGVAILLGEETDLLHLSIRLPAYMQDLAPIITHQTELRAKDLDK